MNLGKIDDPCFLLTYNYWFRLSLNQDSFSVHCFLPSHVPRGLEILHNVWILCFKVCKVLEFGTGCWKSYYNVTSCIDV